MKDKTCVVITGGYRWQYYHWFLLGFYKLQELGEITLKFKMPLFSRLLTYRHTAFGYHVLNHLQRAFESDTYNMTGYVIFADGTKKQFTIDSSDAPYMFTEKLLKETDAYFKIQYPCEIENDAFHLTPDIVIPWLDSEHVDGNIEVLTARGERKRINDLHQYIHKIYPLMQGPRSLSIGLSRKSLTKGYDNYLSNRALYKPKRVMCYFGNSLGPKPETVDIPDYLWEGDVMGFFKEMVSHPNEKRAVVADHIAALDNSDARVISRANADSGSEKNEELIIPLSDFCAHVAKFQYNFNVSGYCKSIPNRFIESFIVGTAIVTDKLCVKWYQPFDTCEVKETVEMGYIPMQDVDWKTFEADLDTLPETDPGSIAKNFDEKWAPDVVANYILDTLRKG